MNAVYRCSGKPLATKKIINNPSLAIWLALLPRPRLQFRLSMESFIIVLLVITSIVSVAFIIERAIALRWNRVIPPEVEQAVDRCRSKSDLPALRKTCEINPSPIARLILIAISYLNCPKNETIDAIQTKARHEVAQLERGLVVLEIATGIAPLLGLVGTIFGMILLFNAMGSEAADQSKFAVGIALALRATLMGLLVAIPSLIFWSYYSRRVETLAVEMENICDEFLQRFYRTQFQASAQAPPPIRSQEGN